MFVEKAHSTVEVAQSKKDLRKGTGFPNNSNSKSWIFTISILIDFLPLIKYQGLSQSFVCTFLETSVILTKTLVF